MDINITAIERAGRFFIPPVAAVVLATVALAATMTDAVSSGAIWEIAFAQILASVRPWLAAVFAAASAWLAWRLWKWTQWQRGAELGGCLRCFGPMAHKGGRYGPYSQCKICGAKREGHH